MREILMILREEKQQKVFCTIFVPADNLGTKFNTLKQHLLVWMRSYLCTNVFASFLVAMLIQQYETKVIEIISLLKIAAKHKNIF